MTRTRMIAPLLLAAAFLVGCALDAASAHHDHAGHLGHGAGGAGFSAGGEAKVSFAREVVPALRTHCASCHSGASAHGPAFFDGQDRPDHAVVERHVGQILLEVQTGRMPAGRPYAMPSDQFRAIDVWAASGAPDN